MHMWTILSASLYILCIWLVWLSCSMAIKRCKWHHKGFLIDTIRIWTHIFGKWVYIFTCASMEHVPKRKWKEKYRIIFYNYIIGIFLVGSHLHNYFCIYQAAKSNRHHHVVDAGFLFCTRFFSFIFSACAADFFYSSSFPLSLSSYIYIPTMNWNTFASLSLLFFAWIFSVIVEIK